MKKLLPGLALILISVSAFATERTPIVTLPGQFGVTAIAAQNGILAIAYQHRPEIYLYAIPNWTQVIATLTVSNPSGAFIRSIAIQNQYIAVGAQDLSGQKLGSVYVFAKPEGGWSSETETAVLKPSNPSKDDGFGDQVSAWGNTLLVGSYISCAYIFVEPGTGWVDAIENAQLTSSDNPYPGLFGIGVALVGGVGQDGSLAVVEGQQRCNGNFGCPIADVYVVPEGGWRSATQSAELFGAQGQLGVTGELGTISAAKSTIAIATPGTKRRQGGGEIYIYDEPEGGWANSNSPNFTASASNSRYLGAYGVTLTQNAQVLVSSFGDTYFKDSDRDLAYLWHAEKDFGSDPITLSAKALTTTLQGATVTEDYAFAWDAYGNVFVFDGK
jgi:hypothetical protein